MTDYNGLWKEIDDMIKERLDRPIQPHEKTLAELREEWHTTYKKTEEIITELIEKGLIQTRRVQSRNGVRVSVYFPTQKDPR